MELFPWHWTHREVNLQSTKYGFKKTRMDREVGTFDFVWLSSFNFLCDFVLLSSVLCSTWKCGRAGTDKLGPTLQVAFCTDIANKDEGINPAQDPIPPVLFVCTFIYHKNNTIFWRDCLTYPNNNEINNYGQENEM